MMPGRQAARLIVVVPVAAMYLLGCGGTRPAATPGGSGEPSSGGSILPWSGGNVKIAYVRSDIISEKLPEYRDADNALKADNDQWTREVERMESQLRGKEAQLEELKLILSAERRKELEDEVGTARKEVQRFRQKTWYDENSEYLKRRKELMEPIDARVNDAIYKVAEARGLDIVLDTVSGNVVFAKPGLDITNMVLEELQR